ncbi:unnamed protein product [Laminaria digitata]
MGFRYIKRRYCGTYVNVQYTGNPGSSLSQYSSTGTYWTRAQPYHYIFHSEKFPKLSGLGFTVQSSLPRNHFAEAGPLSMQALKIDRLRAPEPTRACYYARAHAHPHRPPSPRGMFSHSLPFREAGR